MKETIREVLWLLLRALSAALILTILSWLFQKQQNFVLNFFVKFLASAILIHIADRRGGDG